MKRSRVMEIINSAVGELTCRVSKQEQGVNGLGNGPGVVNGLIVDKAEREGHLKTLESCDPLERLDVYLQIIECSARKRILEEIE